MEPVSERLRRAAAAVACVVLAGLFAPTAGAFFPLGGFDAFNTLRLVKWRLNDFDNNNDGDIREDEGLEVLIEGGPAGFTEAEIEIIRDALDVWGNVPTSYAAFRVQGITRDPLLAGVQPDFRNVIAMQVTVDENDDNVLVDPSDIVLGDVGFPVLGVCVILFTVEDTILEVAGQGITVGAGTILDADIIIDANSVRPDPVTGANAFADLHGVMVHELGHFLGLGHTPLNNLRPSGPPAGGGVITPLRLLENPAIHITGSDGEQRHVGVTPTMYPVYWAMQVGDDFVPGMSDLAPDDIAAISYLYPRGSQNNFFTVNHEARSRRRPGSGFPSVPLTGGHVVAWADTDNNPDTPYVPVFSTMAGLYEPAGSPQLGGRFRLINMWKQMERPGTQGARFTPSYVFTVTPLNFTGFDRQAPPGILPEDTDTISGPAFFSVNPRSATDYTNAFPSEVFHEVENLIDVQNRDAGTAMVWSFERNTLISTSTGRSLATIRSVDLPMFGDPNDVCPLNIIESGAGGGTTVVGAVGPDTLRRFRDNVLLESVIGTALVGLYYEVGPVFARYLLGNAAAFEAWRRVVVAMYWSMENYRMIALALCGAALALVGWRLRRRLGRAAAGGLLALALLTAAGEAGAAIAFVTDAQLATGATDIVVGKVVAQEARWARGGRIFTDYALELSHVAKGTLNKNTNVTVSVIGGQIGALRVMASEMPALKVGDEVVLYLKFRANAYVIHGGLRGTQRVISNGKGGLSVETYSEYLSGEAGEALKAAYAPETVGAEVKHSDHDHNFCEAHDHGAKAAPVAIPLEEYVAYLRALPDDGAEQP